MITRVLIRSGGDSDRPLAVFQGVSAVEEGEGDSISMAEAIGEKDRLPGVGNRPVREGEGPERKARRRRREGTGSDAAQWRAGRGVRVGREAYDGEITTLSQFLIGVCQGILQLYTDEVCPFQDMKILVVWISIQYRPQT